MKENKKNQIIIFHVTSTCLSKVTFKLKIGIERGSIIGTEKGIQAAGTSSTKGLSWDTPGLAREHSEV